MRKKGIPKQLSFSNIIALVALFIALGGTSYAATQLSKNSVGNAQLRADAVSTSKVRDGAITKDKLDSDAVTGSKVRDGSITSDKIKDATITSTQIKNGSLRAKDFQEGDLPVGPMGAVGPVGPAGTPGAKGDKGDTGDSYLNGAYYATAIYDNGDTNGGAIATVACKEQTDTAISGGVSVDDYTKNVPVGQSFPGREDFSTFTPKPGRLDGWIVQFASQNTSNPEKVKVWALCVPNLNVPVIPTYTQSANN